MIHEIYNTLFIQPTGYVIIYRPYVKEHLTYRPYRDL